MTTATKTQNSPPDSRGWGGMKGWEGVGWEPVLDLVSLGVKDFTGFITLNNVYAWKFVFTLQKQLQSATPNLQAPISPFLPATWSVASSRGNVLVGHYGHNQRSHLVAPSSPQPVLRVRLHSLEKFRFCLRLLRAPSIRQVLASTPPRGMDSSDWFLDWKASQAAELA